MTWCHTVAAIESNRIRMKICIRSSVFALAALAAPASAQDDAPPVGTIVYGVLMPEDAETYGIPLAEGEEIIGVIDAPSVIQMPDDTETIYETIPYTPPADIDRVTGLPRNTPGWTGEFAGPVAIGCFPQGVCADLN